jgi:hypothetical protein
MDIQQEQQLNILRSYLFDNGIMEEVEVDELIAAIRNSRLKPEDIGALVHDISNEVGIPTISATRVKVEVWRRTINKFLLAGLVVATIESLVPGIYYSLYETL